MMNEYLTIRENALYETQIERSIFKAFSFRVEDELEAREKIKEMKVKYKEATHVCSAYHIEEKVFTDDNGEPSGTAGSPILNALRGSGKTHVLVVVVRYFGGKKLGVRGLIDAYGGSASEVLKISGEEIIYKGEVYDVTIPYSDSNSFFYHVEKENISVLDKEFTDVVRVKVFVKKDQEDDFLSYIKGYQIN